MKAIIIAAGSGKRISKEVKDVPKSLVKVNNKSIIEYQVTELKKADIHEIFVITGPHSEKFQYKNLKYIKDEKFAEHDILGSLMEAKEILKNDVLVIYSDIIFELKILEQILDSKADISIAVDMNWEKTYDGRTNHPISEAENVELMDSKIIRIQKNIKKQNNDIGEFLGIIKFSSEGSRIFVNKFEKLLKTHTGKFQTAPSLLKAYLTDMIQELVDSKIEVKPVFISGKWCEIDTFQDLKNAEKKFS